METAVRRPPMSILFTEKKLSDRAFHLELDQSFQFDRVFHRKLADEVVNEAVYAQAHRLRLAQAALLHVEDLFGADLTDAGFVLYGVARSADSNRRIGVGAAGRVDQECVALGVVLAMLQVLGHMHEAAISRAACADRNRFRNNVRSRLISGVNHFRAGVLVLTIVSERDGEHFAASFGAFQRPEEPTL